MLLNTIKSRGSPGAFPSTIDSRLVGSGGSSRAVHGVAKYGRMKRATLLRSVFGRYPWYAQNSELTDFVPDDVPRRPRRRAAASTVGYEGKSVDGFFNDLLASGIGAILDVRANPVSRKYGFAKRSMRQIAQSLDL